MDTEGRERGEGIERGIERVLRGEREREGIESGREERWGERGERGESGG